MSYNLYVNVHLFFYFQFWTKWNIFPPETASTGQYLSEIVKSKCVVYIKHQINLDYKNVYLTPIRAFFEEILI